MDRESIIRQVVMANVPFMADKFYEKETKKRKKDGKFRYKFQDLIDAVSDRAQVLKAQGKNVTKEISYQTTKVAAMANMPDKYWNEIIGSSPPKLQQAPTIERQTMQYKCRFCAMAHTTELCQKLMQMTVEQRLEALKRAGFCFRCLTRGHVARDCPDIMPPICGECQLGHQSMLHDPDPYMATQIEV